MGHTRNTQTKGVWLWGQPQAVSLPADQPGSPPQQVRSGLALHSPWALLLHAMLRCQKSVLGQQQAGRQHSNVQGNSLSPNSTHTALLRYCRHPLFSLTQRGFTARASRTPMMTASLR